VEGKSEFSEPEAGGFVWPGPEGSFSVGR